MEKKKSNNSIFTNFINKKKTIESRNNNNNSNNTNSQFQTVAHHLNRANNKSSYLFVIGNSPIIYNSISEFNLIQNITNVILSRTGMKDKQHLTERNHNVLVVKRKSKKVKDLYLNKAKMNIIHDMSLINKKKMNDILLKLKKKNKNGEKKVDSKKDCNYYLSNLDV